MAQEFSDFVLDEGLDDDEDILAFHSNRQRGGGGYAETAGTPQPNASPTTPTTPPPSSPPDLPPQTTTVIIDGMPPTSSRPDLDAFFSACGGKILSLQLRRIEASNILRARIKFDSEEAAASALQRDGQVFPRSDLAVSVKPASMERWNDGCGSQRGNGAPGATLTSPTNSIMQMLPDTNAVTSGFWSAFSAARSAAERLEEKATKLGEQLEEKLHLSEKVDETRDALVEVDRKLQVSEKVGKMAVAGKSAAQGIDETYGISKQVGKVAADVGSAARTMASEVDEDFHLSEKARVATNLALQNDTVGPAVRSIVDNFGATPTGEAAPSPRKDGVRRKKNYQPSGVEQNAVQTQLPGANE
ncbi:unnamed protein product [Chondrus crispus]|uniref:RRM domain-containing protein n=1 Tax=Chondrus crispus TaxID=2769 RepID=R7QRC8_CHOCR|nr:unnamed protein product [Chondrus crispus]CDF41032.1 unnamed protein product [Chondrus crispus]|eukprot:XP_005711326.1 unnamed protein product [Chondrus crispus]